MIFPVIDPNSMIFPLEQANRTKSMAEAWDAYAARAQVISWEKIRPKKKSNAKKK